MAPGADRPTSGRAAIAIADREPMTDSWMCRCPAWMARYHDRARLREELGRVTHLTRTDRPQRWRERADRLIHAA